MVVFQLEDGLVGHLEMCLVGFLGSGNVEGLEVVYCMVQLEVVQFCRGTNGGLSCGGGWRGGGV